MRTRNLGKIPQIAETSYADFSFGQNFENCQGNKLFLQTLTLVDFDKFLYDVVFPLVRIPTICKILSRF